ncbi:hypothetical protein EX895_005114 [Sporisorium graminicola]|uniref:Uncharacterized protein n=1 Tax=Sporisorium graminicola TaxID=280036 RepID=A0A4V6ETQ1_9BASI|nr:hypothetical protein EX895_005114 [Sporisorium graminicola]TKY86289.1 hypothetical protein EX895_005114 [Sporisorium graminicola]
MRPLLSSLTNPSIRTRRLATSTFFMATFAASILTVSLSASTILPCPANSRSKTRGTLADSDHVTASSSPSPPAAEAEAAGGGEQGGWHSGAAVGQKVILTRKGGWIEIDQPLKPASS